ncbi:MAG: AAA family ATPase, partial [Dictyoglomus turgidum]
AELLIIDEASMLTWRLLSEVFKTNPRWIILCGDPEQLPPVQGENTFKSLLEVLPKVSLNTIYRGSFQTKLIKLKSVDEVINKVVELARNLARAKKQFQVITSRYDTPCGVNVLNRVLKDVKEIEPKVIVNKNYYDREGNLLASNGQTGTLIRKDSSMAEVRIDGHSISIPLKYLSPAYAISVHKSQGSEWDYVIYVKHPIDSEQLQRTATTRAKVLTYVLSL